MALTTEKKKPAAPVLARGGRRATAQPGLFGTRPRNKLRLVLAVLLALMSLGPLLYMVSLSFQNNNYILGNTVLIPNHPTTELLPSLVGKQLRALLLQQPRGRLRHRYYHSRLGLAGCVRLRAR